MRRIHGVPPGAAAVATLVLASAALRAWAAWEVPAPWFAGDEVIYALLGRSLWEHGSFDILGAPTGFLSLVYPAFAGVPLALGGVGAGYDVLRVIQPLLMSLAAVPAYLWARSLGAGRWAIAAAALTVAIPSLAYSGFVLTEVAFYPVALLAVWAMAAAVERPTVARQGLFVAAVGLAALTRLQAVVLVPVAITAIVVEALAARDLRRVARLWRSLVGFIALGLVWVFWRLASGGGMSGLLGGYGSAGQGYDAGAAARFVYYHAGGVLLVAGVAPVCAVATMCVSAIRRREPNDGVRAYLAVVTTLSAWLVLQVGVFASQYGPRLEERYLIVLAPVFFVGLCVWLARGGPRPPMRTLWIAVLTFAVLVVLPLKRLLPVDAKEESMTGLALWRELQPGHFQVAVVIGAAVVILLWALLPRRLLVVLPVVLLAAFVAASVSSSREAIAEAAAQKARLVGADPRWIDNNARGPVAFLWDGDTYWTAVWENAFFNDRLTRIVDLPRTFVPGPLPQKVVAPRPDGTIDGLPGYVVAWDSFTFDGDEVARTPLTGVNHAALVLWRLRTPRVSTRAAGLTPNGELSAGGFAQLTVYDCRKGDAQITMFAKDAGTVVISRGQRVARTLQLDPGQVWNGTVPALPVKGICTFGIATSGLLGVTQLGFARAS